MYFKRIAFIVACFSILWAGVIPAYGDRLLHDKEALLAFEGWGNPNPKEKAELRSPFEQLIDTLSERMDKSRFGGTTVFAPSNHRDVYHPILLGEEIPKDHLESACKSWLRKSEGITSPTTEDLARAKATLMGMRRDYVNACIDKTMELTGLPRKQAESLAGLINVVHLVGDYDLKDNYYIESLPNRERLAKAMNRYLDDLFKGADDEVLAWVAKEKLYIGNLLKRARDDVDFASLLKYEFFRKEPLGEYLSKRWGGTLAAKGSVYSEEFARQVSREVTQLRRVDAKDRINKWNSSSRTRNKAKKLGIQNKNINNHLTRVSKSAWRETQEAMTKGVVEQRVGVLQTMRSASGEVVDVLTVPVKSLAKGVAAGASAGVLTLVFGQGTTYAMYQAGVMTEDEFLLETEKNCGAALVTGATTFVLISLGATPTGWVVLGVGTATDILYGMCFDEVQWIQSFDWEKDWIFGEVPTDIQRRNKFLSSREAKAFFHFPNRTTLLDWSNNPEILRRSTLLDWSKSSEIEGRTTILNGSSSKKIRSRRTFF